MEREEEVLLEAGAASALGEGAGEKRGAFKRFGTSLPAVVSDRRLVTRAAGLLPRELRWWLRTAPRRVTGRTHHRGGRVQCPCCGSRYRDFAPLNGPNRSCWRCGSLERDRLLWLLFDRDPTLLWPGMKILHVAPEHALRRRLKRTAAIYVSGDRTGTFADEIIDITRLGFADDVFDAVVCNHVLEHIPDDRAAMRELRRVLAPHGWAILLVPDVEFERTIEDPAVTDAQDRLALFGQEDHVRRYGLDYLDRLTDAGFTPQALDLSDELGDAVISRHCLRKFGRVEPIFLCR